MPTTVWRQAAIGFSLPGGTGGCEHYPSLRPNGWYKLIGENPEALEPRARPGYLWIEVDGRPRQVWAGHFKVEFTRG